MACGIGANTCAALTYRCLKYSLFVYCFLFWVLGLVLLLLGIYAETQRPETRELQHVFLAPAIILILCGLTLFSISLIGAVGALRDNTTFLHTFFGFLVVGLLLQLVGGVIALIFRDQAYNFFSNRLRNGIRHYYDDLDFKNIMDFTQIKLSCCGAESYMDWKVNEYHSCEAPGPAACGVPYSCCVQPKGVKPVINSQCGFGALLEERIEVLDRVAARGCINATAHWLNDHFTVMAILLFVLFFPQFLGLLLCCIYIERLQDLIRDYKNEKDQRATLVETKC